MSSSPLPSDPPTPAPAPSDPLSSADEYSLVSDPPALADYLRLRRDNGLSPKTEE